ncbi:MAG: hypothetical protein JSU95_18400 [Betaproteobacteria bacterium]|nr:MAG: hypothetical protein JSU95_18400 [Betaproteobacteria bacterium]
MKTKLLVFILGAALVGSSTAALAERERGGRHDGPRAEQRHQRDWSGDHRRKDRVYARSDRYERGHRRDPYWAKGHRHGRHWGKGRHHGRHWKKGHRHGRHWEKRPYYRHHADRPAPYRRYHGHGGHYGRHGPRDSVTIIFRGHL